MNEKDLWKKLAESVVLMKEEQVAAVANTVLENGFSAKEAILNGLSEGMRQVGVKFSEKVYFVPEVLVCADVMYRGFDILKDCAEDGDKPDSKKNSVLIGVVEGDFHDIGKNIVGLMLSTDGFIIHDLGANISASLFLEKIAELEPDIVALSTLMSTTLDNMKTIVDRIREEFSDRCPKIMVGGAPVSEHFAEQIGADFYGEDAGQAVVGAKQLVRIA